TNMTSPCNADTTRPTARGTLAVERPPRSIVRVALLQDYAGRPERLVDELPEIARKGYHGVDTWVGVDNLDFFRQFCESAHALGLSVGAATSYMIGQFAHLAQHPEQRLVQSADDIDVDGLGLNTWG